MGEGEARREGAAIIGPAAAVDTFDQARSLGAVSAALFGEPDRRKRLGRFFLLERLGAGGMGLVLAAYDPQLDRKVAIKILRRDLADETDGSQARLLREARAMARLSHPHVVTVHEAGEEGGRVYIAMEYLDGGSLRDWLGAQTRGWRRILEVFAAAGEGLAAAHRAGLVHRDFKPENVLVTADENPRVGDFGIARPLRSLAPTEPHPLGETVAMEEEMSLTGTGGVVGTPAYMAPEVFAFEPADARSDQFSFCVALYEALYGDRPFAGSTVARLQQEVTEGTVRPAPARAEVPAPVRRILLRGLATRPEDRYPDMESLVAALRARLVPPRARVWIAGGIGVGAVATVAMFASQPEAEAAPCTGGAEAMAEVWSEDRARGLLEEMGAEAADATRIRDSFDGYAGRWVEAHREACLDTAVRKVQSAAKLDARMLCLDGRLRALAGTLGALEGRSGLSATQTLEAAEGLPSVALCQDARNAEQLEPEAREARLVLEEELARVQAVERSGDPQGAATAAVRLVERAEAMDDPVARARIRFLAGSMGLRAGETGRATEHLEHALIEAERAGADRLRIEILVARVADAVLGRKLDEAKLRAEHAAALLEHYGGDPKLQANLEAQRGTLAYYEGRYEEAATHHRASLELIRAQPHRDVSLEISTLGNLGLALRDQGALEQALAIMEEARALRVERYGASSPALATDDLNLGMVLDSMTRFDDAVAVLERGLQVTARTRGGESSDAAQLHEGLGYVLGNLEHHEQAIEHHRRAQAILTALGQTEHPDMAMSLGNEAMCLVQLERTGEALPLQRRALEIWETSLGAEHPDVAYALRDLGVALTHEERYEEAVEVLERAVTIRTEHEMPPLLLGDARYHLALALEPVDRERALKVARQALKDYEAAGHPDGKLVVNGRELIERLEN